MERQTCTRGVSRGKPRNGVLGVNCSAIRALTHCPHTASHFTDGSHTRRLFRYGILSRRLRRPTPPAGLTACTALPPHSRPVRTSHPPLAPPALIHMPLSSAPNQTFFMLVLGATNACRAHAGDRHARVADYRDLGRQSPQSPPRRTHPTPFFSSPQRRPVWIVGGRNTERERSKRGKRCRQPTSTRAPRSRAA